MKGLGFYKAGAVVLILLGMAHMLGHYSMVTSVPANEQERQLKELLYGYTQDMGLGFVRGMGHIQEGFSLTFSLLSMVIGVLLLVVIPGLTPALLRRVSVVNCGWLGIWLGVGLKYWFPAPDLFIAVAWLCMVGAVVKGRS